jgi:hypothetical protein
MANRENLAILTQDRGYVELLRALADELVD